MSKYFTAWDNFAVDTIGTDVAGWTERGSTGPNSQAPAYGTPCFKKRYLALKSSSSATPMRSALSWDAIDADANRDDVDIVTAFSYDATTASQVWVYARGVGGSATAPDECYIGIVDKSTGTNNLIIARRNAATTIATIATASLTLAAAKNYFIRFRVNGTALKLKVWDAALGRAGEPAAWNLETTDATYSAAGWVGLGLINAGVADQVAAFNFFAVGTNGDVAVCPLTNAEYSAWLASQEAQRVITARLAFTGYDSSSSPYTATRYAYISDHGYTSHEQDTPARQHFDNYIRSVPTFSREMPAALSGQAVVNFGEMRVKNPSRPVPGAAYLLLDGASGCYASTPDAAVNSITGDIDLRIKVAPDDWTPTGYQTLMNKGSAAGNLAWLFRLEITTGRLFLFTSADGTALVSATATAAVPGVVDGQSTWVRVTRDVDNGAAGNTTKFYYSTDYNPDTQAGTWTQIGADVTNAGVTSIFNSTAVVEIGSKTTGAQERLAGKVYRAQIYNGIAGTLAVDFNLANVLKGATSFSAPTGEVWTVNGTARIRQAEETQPGMLDDWTRIHWIRDGFEMWLGDPDEPHHNHRHIVRGRLGLPTAPRPDEMVFRIADMSDALNVPLTDQVFSTGDRANRYKPVFIGHNVTGHIEPPQSDYAALEWTLHDATINLADAVAYDNHVALVGLLRTVSAVDAGTDTITASSAHGMVNGYRVRFSSGTPPAPLALSTDYYAVSVTVGGSDFKLSATLGGAAINLTTTSTGAAMVFYGFRYDNAAAEMTLAATPAGRVTFTNVKSNSGLYDVANIYSDIVFSRAGLSLNHKDSGSFTALTAALGFTARLFFDDSKHACNEAVERLSVGSMSWYGFTTDGLMQVGLIDLPAATAVQSFDISNVKADSLRLVDRIRPIDFFKAQITCEPYFLSGGPMPPVGSTGQVIQERTTVTPYSYGATSTPLDNYPSVSDANVNASFDWVMDNGNAEDRRDAIAALFLQALGIFEFDTTLPASELNIGDTITLDFPRLGWKTYSSADPASPDNTATIDATKAVVIGLNVNLSAAGPFKVRVKCFRRQPGYYPTANLN